MELRYFFNVNIMSSEMEMKVRLDYEILRDAPSIIPEGAAMPGSQEKEAKHLQNFIARFLLELGRGRAHYSFKEAPSFLTKDFKPERAIAEPLSKKWVDDSNFYDPDTSTDQGIAEIASHTFIKAVLERESITGRGAREDLDDFGRRIAEATASLSSILKNRRQIPKKSIGVGLTLVLAACGIRPAAPTITPEKATSTPTVTETSPTITEAPTITNTSTQTKIPTATEFIFEPLVLQTKAENPANYTEITLDGIKSGRVTYFERQAYEQGTLPQFTSDAKYVPVVDTYSNVLGMWFHSINPDYHSIHPGQYSSKPETLPMRFVTYYDMKTDSGEDIWIVGLEVLNKDNSVSFLHLGFDPKLWGAKANFDTFLKATSGDLFIPGIVSITTNCKPSETPPARGFYLDFSKVCEIYKNTWSMDDSSQALNEWSKTGQITTDMEEKIYPYIKWPGW